MATIAAEMKSKGVDVINFSVGEPDFNTPSHIIDAGKEAMDNGYTKYTAGPGMIECREAICQKLERENGIVYKKENILVSNGEKQTWYFAQVTLKTRKNCQFCRYKYVSHCNIQILKSNIFHEAIAFAKLTTFFSKLTIKMLQQII